MHIQCREAGGRARGVHAGRNSWASSDSAEVGLGDRDGDKQNRDEC